MSLLLRRALANEGFDGPGAMHNEQDEPLEDNVEIVDTAGEGETPYDDTIDMVELSDDIDKDVDEINGVSQKLDALEAIHDIVKERIMFGGLQPHDAKLVDIALEAHGDRDIIDVGRNPIPAYESAYSHEQDRLIKSHLVYEAIGDKLRKGMAYAINILKELIRKFTTIISNLFGGAVRANKRLIALSKKLSENASDYQTKSGSVKDSFISKLIVIDKFDISYAADVFMRNEPTYSKSLVDGANTTISYLNKGVKDLIAYLKSDNVREGYRPLALDTLDLSNRDNDFDSNMMKSSEVLPGNLVISSSGSVTHLTGKKQPWLHYHTGKWVDDIKRAMNTPPPESVDIASMGDLSTAVKKILPAAASMPKEKSVLNGLLKEADRFKLLVSDITKYVSDKTDSQLSSDARRKINAEVRRVINDDVIRISSLLNDVRIFYAYKVDVVNAFCDYAEACLKAK